MARRSSGLSRASNWRKLWVLKSASFGLLRLWSRHTSMKSAALGNSTSGPEVTNVSQHGLWLLLGREELFLPFEQFPWFQNAPIGKVLHVEQPSAQHLY